MNDWVSWVGVDVRCLIQGVGPEAVGPSVPAMVGRIEYMLSKDRVVCVVTPWVGHHGHSEMVGEWLDQQFGPFICVTDHIDDAMVEFYSHTAIRVDQNTGMIDNTLPPDVFR